MNPNFSLITKSQGFSFVLGAVVAVVIAVLLLRGMSAAQAQAKSGVWVITGELKTPKGNSFYRVEDPEMKVVCYTQAYADFSGGLSCVKK